MAQKGYKSFSLPVETMKELEDLRKAYGERSWTATAIKIIGEARAKISRKSEREANK